jgi:hypothetical protein
VASAADNAALLVAALDLDLVQLLRSAMRAADIASGRTEPISALGPAPTPPPDRFDREPVFQPRRVYHPEPRFAPREVIGIDSPKELAASPAKTELKAQPVEAETSCCSVTIKPEMESPLAPPWRQPVWANPIPPALKVKIVKIRPDIINKGSLIDFFI